MVYTCPTLGGGGGAEQVQMNSSETVCLACVKKLHKCKFVSRLLSMIVAGCKLCSKVIHGLYSGCQRLHTMLSVQPC